MIDIKKLLREYDGPTVRFMEVCGTHTAEISKCGIVSMLSSNIKLISGPGCPVCVTVSSYIDRLIALSKLPQNVVVTFGDMLRVRGSKQNLLEAKAEGAKVQMVYSPMDTLVLAEKNPEQNFIFAAVGFETTTPIYALLIQEAIQRKIFNVKLLTSLKTMPPVIDWICKNQHNIDGFLAPGHVSVITGSNIFKDLSLKYNIPFVVAGFEGEQLLSAIYALTKRCGKGGVFNLYPSVVTPQGNEKAQKLISQYFEPCTAAWRGIGKIALSGKKLRKEYELFDAGSSELWEDQEQNSKCQCAKVLTGMLSPNECPLFGNTCTPQTPQGACMVSTEGSCYHYFINQRR